MELPVSGTSAWLKAATFAALLTAPALAGPAEHREPNDHGGYGSDAKTYTTEIFVTQHLEFGLCNDACPPQIIALARLPTALPPPPSPEVTITLPVCESEGQRGKHRDPETRTAHCDGCHRTVVYYETVDVPYVTLTTVEEHISHPTVSTIYPDKDCDVCTGTVIICEPAETGYPVHTSGGHDSEYDPFGHGHGAHRDDDKVKILHDGDDEHKHDGKDDNKHEKDDHNRPDKPVTPPADEPVWPVTPPANEPDEPEAVLLTI
jgi:hypothetical protein